MQKPARIKRSKRTARARYVVVLYSGERALRELWRAPGVVKTIESGDGAAIVKVWHTNMARALEAINSVAGIKSLKTSGTIRRAKEIAGSARRSLKRR